MRTRFRVVAVLLAGALAVLAARTVQVMVLGHERYAELAHRQQERKLTVPSLRGEIRTADGYLLATSVSRVAAQVDRQLLGDPELFARAAAPILGQGVLGDEAAARLPVLGRGLQAQGGASSRGRSFPRQGQDRLYSRLCSRYLLQPSTVTYTSQSGGGWRL